MAPRAMMAKCAIYVPLLVACTLDIAAVRQLGSVDMLILLSVCVTGFVRSDTIQ